MFRAYLLGLSGLEPLFKDYTCRTSYTKSSARNGSSMYLRLARDHAGVCSVKTDEAQFKPSQDLYLVPRAPLRQSTHGQTACRMRA